MKIFKQTIGFLLLLALLLFGKQYVCVESMQVFAAVPTTSSDADSTTSSATNSDTDSTASSATNSDADSATSSSQDSTAGGIYSGIQIPTEVGNKIDELNLLDPSDLNKENSNDLGVNYIGWIVYYIIDILKYILYSIALIYIIIAALNLITAQGDEGKIKSNKDTIVFALFGFIIILFADTAVKQVFYGGGGGSGDIGPAECLFNPSVCAKQGSKELLGIVSWGKTLLAVIAVIEIIVSGIRMIMAIGADDIIEKEKKVFIWVGIGLLLLAINEVVIEKVLYITDESGAPKPNERLEISTNLQNGINQFVGVIQFILQFVAVMAVVSLIYGGFLMVMHFGDDENVTKAKGIIRDAIIGIVVSLSAYTIVSTIIIKGG